MDFLRRALERIAHFFVGLRQLFHIDRPHCYCLACDVCKGTATLRFPSPVHMYSCPNCIACLAKPEDYYFEMSRWYLFRYAVEAILHEIACKVGPSDPKDEYQFVVESTPEATTK